MLTTHEIAIRVRYQETDAQGIVHHANYLTWFEQGRVELLRAAGLSYRALEEAGVILVVAEAHVRYYAAARFDDELRLVTTTVRAKGARIEHGPRRGDDNDRLHGPLGPGLAPARVAADELSSPDIGSEQSRRAGR